MRYLGAHKVYAISDLPRTDIAFTGAISPTDSGYAESSFVVYY